MVGMVHSAETLARKSEALGYGRLNNNLVTQTSTGLKFTSPVDATHNTLEDLPGDLGDFVRAKDAQAEKESADLSVGNLKLANHSVTSTSDTLKLMGQSLKTLLANTAVMRTKAGGIDTSTDVGKEHIDQLMTQLSAYENGDKAHFNLLVDFGRTASKKVDGRSLTQGSMVDPKGHVIPDDYRIRIRGYYFTFKGLNVLSVNPKKGGVFNAVKGPKGFEISYYSGGGNHAPTDEIFDKPINFMPKDPKKLHFSGKHYTYGGLTKFLLEDKDMDLRTKKGERLHFVDPTTGYINFDNVTMGEGANLKSVGSVRKLLETRQITASDLRQALIKKAEQQRIRIEGYGAHLSNANASVAYLAGRSVMAQKSSEDDVDTYGGLQASLQAVNKTRLAIDLSKSQLLRRSAEQAAVSQGSGAADVTIRRILAQ